MKKILALVFLIPSISYATETGTAVAVVDGNTIIVQFHGRSATVRLLGIEAGDRNSAEYLRRLVQGRSVWVSFNDAGAYVYRYPDGAMVNREMIAAGFATTDRSRDFEYRSDFAAAEEIAKLQRRGRWSGQTFATEWEARFTGVKYLGVASPRPETKTIRAPAPSPAGASASGRRGRERPRTRRRVSGVPNRRN